MRDRDSLILESLYFKIIKERRSDETFDQTFKRIYRELIQK